MPSLEEIRENRPLEATVARWFLLGAALLWLPVMAHLDPTVRLAPITLFVAIFGAFGVAKGRQAGRILSAIGLLATYAVLLPYCWLGFSDSRPGSGLFAVLDIVAVVASGFALTQMFHPAVNRYIHLVGVAMRS